jgi:DNA-binding NarL/FixJ family response regulator
MSTVLRAVVAEDNLVLLAGLRAVLQAHDVVVAAACTSLDELVATVDAATPDVVVTDIRMPPDHTDEGIRAARRFRRTHPGLGVLVVSQFVEPGYALALLDDGSHHRGYLLKDRLDQPAVLLDAVQAVASGGSWIDGEVVDALVRARRSAVDSPLDRLTPREHQILAFVASGRSNAAVADELGVSGNAVEKHISSIFAKLGLGDDATVNRRVKATLAFLAHGGGSG